MALYQYNIGLILSFIGIIIFTLKIIKEKSPIVLFIVITSIIVALISFNQIRYQYYFGPIIAILAAVALERIYSLQFNFNHISNLKNASQKI